MVSMHLQHYKWLVQAIMMATKDKLVICPLLIN